MWNQSPQNRPRSPMPGQGVNGQWQAAPQWPQQRYRPNQGYQPRFQHPQGFPPYQGYRPQQGYQGYRPQQSRRKGGAALALIAVLFVCGVIGLIVIYGLLSYMANPSPSPEPAPRPAPVDAEDEQDRGDYPLQDPNTLPDIVVPEYDSDLELYLIENPLYNQSIDSPVDCEAKNLNVLEMTNEEAEEHFNLQMACLMRTFTPALERAGYENVRPQVHIYSTEIQTSCGTADTHNAFYCGANQQIYYADDFPQVLSPNAANQPYMIEVILAHEFGHAIQGRTGILASSVYVENALDEKGDESGSLLFSRASELQADCLAGMWVSSVQEDVGLTAEDTKLIGTHFGELGDDVLSGDPDIEGTHGHGDNRTLWFTRGSSVTRMGTCSTFDESVPNDELD